MKLCRKTVKETYLQLISGQNRSVEESNLTWKPISWRLSVRLLPWRSRRTLRIFPRYTRHCYSFKLSQLWPKNIFEIDTKRQQDNNFSCETQGFLSYIVITSRDSNWRTPRGPIIFSGPDIGQLSKNDPIGWFPACCISNSRRNKSYQWCHFLRVVWGSGCELALFKWE